MNLDHEKATKVKKRILIKKSPKKPHFRHSHPLTQVQDNDFDFFASLNNKTLNFFPTQTPQLFRLKSTDFRFCLFKTTFTPFLLTTTKSPQTHKSDCTPLTFEHFSLFSLFTQTLSLKKYHRNRACAYSKSHTSKTLSTPTLNFYYLTHLQYKQKQPLPLPYKLCNLFNYIYIYILIKCQRRVRELRRCGSGYRGFGFEFDF